MLAQIISLSMIDAVSSSVEYNWQNLWFLFFFTIDIFSQDQW